MEHLYQLIGAEVLRLAGNNSGKILLIGEIDEGVISADLFCQENKNKARYKYTTTELQDLAYQLWKNWEKWTGKKSWSIMCFQVNKDKISMDLIYSDQIDPEEDELQRREKIIEKVFGKTKVDYSRPE